MADEPGQREEQFLSEPEVQRIWMKRLTISAVVSSAAILVLSLVVSYKLLSADKTKYLSIDSVGRVRQFVLQDKPVLSERTRMSWMIVCVMRATGFSFDKTPREIEEARSCFTASGWNKYFSAFKNVYWSDITNNNTNVSGAPAGVPVFVSKYLQDGVLFYQYTIPWVVTVENNNGRKSQNLQATVLIQDVGFDKSENGLAIAYLTMEPRQ